MGVQGVKKYSNDMLLEYEGMVAFIFKNIKGNYHIMKMKVLYSLTAFLLSVTIF